MRVLPFLVPFLAVCALTPGPVAGRPDAAAALVPLAQALGGRPERAEVEVFAEETVKNRPSVRILEVETLPRAKWSSSPLGTGEIFSARRGALRARIAWTPLPQGGGMLVCARSISVVPGALAQALRSLGAPPPPCGLMHYAASLTLKIPQRLTRQKVLNAFSQIGARPQGVLEGADGIYALADLPRATPTVTVGGIPMNLALRATYDSARGEEAVLATPTLPGDSP